MHVPLVDKSHYGVIKNALYLDNGFLSEREYEINELNADIRIGNIVEFSDGVTPSDRYIKCDELKYISHEHPTIASLCELITPEELSSTEWVSYDFAPFLPYPTDSIRVHSVCWSDHLQKFGVLITNYISGSWYKLLGGTSVDGITWTFNLIDEGTSSWDIHYGYLEYVAGTINKFIGVGSLGTEPMIIKFTDVGADPIQYLDFSEYFDSNTVMSMIACLDSVFISYNNVIKVFYINDHPLGVNAIINIANLSNTRWNHRCVFLYCIFY